MNIQNSVNALLGKAASGVGYFILLLTDSARTSSENKKLDNAANGGVMNFRTDELDDGTDPAGWYLDD